MNILLSLMIYIYAIAWLEMRRMSNKYAIVSTTSTKIYIIIVIALLIAIEVRLVLEMC